ncbi:sensor histidine kinase [Paenibacillus eucommiae]|uniref:Two-component system sensor histidine kinase YesM n=1 Tax=Paenibacillus eucommiae TaxID=1355755 RepID=A0ABS4IMG2_9BACL|nr:histidine kinase [Paenibacillus eucommiae]MBP1988729.1 two-component system sensor histidine kinase YesM [Paenibacillus eucommiae]
MVDLNRMKKWRPTIFVKLMLTFISVLAPLYLLTLAINESGSNSIRREISQSLASRNDFYLNMLDLEVGRIVRMLPEYAVDNDLRALSTTGDSIADYEKVEDIMGIQKRINLIKYNSIYIQEVRAYIPLLRRTILTSTFETSIDEAEFEALQLKNNKEGSPLIYWNDRLFVSMQYPSISTRSPVFQVSVELSVDKLKHTLQEMISIPQGNAVLFNLNQEWTLSNESEPSIPEALRNYLAMQRQQGLLSGYDTLKFGKSPYLVSYRYSSMLDCYLASYVPERDIIGPISKYQHWILGISILSMFIVLFFSISIFRMIHRPLKGLISAFKRMRTGDIRPIANVGRHDEFGYLYKAYNETAVHLKTLIQENYEQKIHSQRSELKRLQSQINPHFLYNCFFVLCRLIKSEDLELAYRFCLYVGDYFQFITRDDADEVPLETEMKHARTYVDIQKVCFGGKIVVEFDTLDVVLGKIRVPRLILQPIVENIYKHAVSKMPNDGKVWIHMEHTSNDLTIYMEDSGDKLTDRDLELLNQKLKLAVNHIDDTTGIINVHRRIQIRYGPDYGLTMFRSDLGGLRVAIKLSVAEGGE